MTRRAIGGLLLYGIREMKKADASELERSINELFELYVYVNGQYVRGDKAVIPVWIMACFTAMAFSRAYEYMTDEYSSFKNTSNGSTTQPRP